MSEDAFLGGRVRLFQPVRGFRAGMDSVMLAAALSAHAGQVLDLGCGVGAVMCCAASRLGDIRITGLERDLGALELARKNIDLNRLGGRLDVVEGDAFSLGHDWQNRFDCVVSNPPFFDVGTIEGPGEGREAAYIAEKGLRSWLNAMLFACRPRGRVSLIHRAAELARILAVLDRQAGEITVLPLVPRTGGAASRILVTARKGLRSGPVTLLSPRALHDGDQTSEWARSVLMHGAAIKFE